VEQRNSVGGVEQGGRRLRELDWLAAMWPSPPRKVRMRRLTLGLSQTDLADGGGVRFQQVEKYEYGANRIGASRLQQIANVVVFLRWDPGSDRQS